MQTIRQLERLWDSGCFNRLYRGLVVARPEGWTGIPTGEVSAPMAAAMAIIRLDELTQSHLPLYSRLVRAIVGAQEADGGWGDPAVTALCIRALLCGDGQGAAIEAGIRHLAELQKSEGIWPGVAVRRLQADPQTSAFVLFELGNTPIFADRVRLADAADWFERHADELDDATRRLWQQARLRCRFDAVPHMEPLIWSRVA